MGLSCSPSLANIFLIKFDHLATHGFKIKPILFFRYLDDIFSLFRGTPLELEEYRSFLNSLIPGISLTFTESLYSVDFLDITIFKYTSRNRTTLQTKIFFKETDSHQLLHQQSYHPKHIFSSILFSQILRFKRICSFKIDFDYTCKLLFSYLKDRGYSYREFAIIKRRVWFEKSLYHPLLVPQTTEPFPFVINHGPLGVDLSALHKKTLKNIL